MQHKPNTPDFGGIIRFKNKTTQQTLCDAKPEKSGDSYTFKCDKNIQILPSNFNEKNILSAQYLDQKYYANSDQITKSVDVSKITPTFQGMSPSDKNASVTCAGNPANIDCFEQSKIIVSGKINFGALNTEQSAKITIQPYWNTDVKATDCSLTTLSQTDHTSTFQCTYISTPGDSKNKRTRQILVLQSTILVIVHINKKTAIPRRMRV